jgi:hypothetical protein
MTDTIQLGAKFQVYPGEMKLFLKVFNNFDAEQLSAEDKELFYNMLDDVQTLVFQNS